MHATTLDILMCFDRRFLIGGAVAIRSITENVAAGKRLRFTILSADLRPRDVERLKRSAAPGPDVAFATHQIDPGEFGKFLRSKHVSHTAYGRLLAGKVLPESVRRTVYVDADVLFLRNIWELAELSLDGKVLAAVPNESLESQQRNLARLGIVADSYFASGLMVIDLSHWREQHIGERAMEFAARMGDRLILHDQDALNGVIEGRFLPLPDRWGYWTIRGEAPTTSVIHYAMTPKPWHADYRGAYRQEFFDCLDRTAFSGWRPVHAFGMGPVISGTLRKMPYLPTVLRVARKRLRNWLPGPGSGNPT